MLIITVSTEIDIQYFLVLKITHSFEWCLLSVHCSGVCGEGFPFVISQSHSSTATIIPVSHTWWNWGSKEGKSAEISLRCILLSVHARAIQSPLCYGFLSRGRSATCFWNSSALFPLRLPHSTPTEPHALLPKIFSCWVCEWFLKASSLTAPAAHVLAPSGLGCPTQ